MIKFVLNGLFPLAILIFIGPSVPLLLSSSLTLNGRWLLLGLLAIYQLFVKVRLQNPMVYFFIALYVFWCISTSFWSEIFQMSLFKSLLYAALTFTMLPAGQVWVAKQGVTRCFDCFTPLAAVMFVLAVLGYFFSPFAYEQGQFRGFFYNSNVFGALMGMSMPPVLWRLYLNRNRPRARWLWIFLAVLGFVFIIMSQSRGALMIGLLSLGGGLLVIPARKLAVYLVAFLCLAAVDSVVQPSGSSGILKRFVYKQSDSNVFYTREEVWNESVEKALLGGSIGGGFGVSIGYGTWSGDGGLTTLGYGREKGSTQLAIMEETGLVGLALYVILLLYLFAVLINRFRRATEMDHKVALGIAVGALGGLVMQSCFEAWWNAPGAMESIYFWSMAGCAMGIGGNGRSRRNAPRDIPTPHRLQLVSER